jgi:hypothetical protein
VEEATGRFGATRDAFILGTEDPRDIFFACLERRAKVAGNRF